MNNKFALIVAVALGALSVFGIHLYIEKIKSTVQGEKELVDVFVATRDIPPGDKIKDQDIAVEQVPQAFVRKLSSSHIRDRRLLVDSTVRIGVSVRQIFQTYHVNVTQEGAKGLDVPEEYRAITLPVNLMSGVGGMLRPGDFCDVVGSFEVKGFRAGSNEVPQLTTYLVKKIKILAVDQQTDPNSNQVNYGYRTVTLRARPDEVTRLLHAQAFGTIYLVKVRDTEPTNDEEVHSISTEVLLERARKSLDGQRKRFSGPGR